jgi:hypothetical protein
LGLAPEGAAWPKTVHHAADIQEALAASENKVASAACCIGGWDAFGRAESAGASFAHDDLLPRQTWIHIFGKQVACSKHMVTTLLEQATCEIRSAIPIAKPAKILSAIPIANRPPAKIFVRDTDREQVTCENSVRDTDHEQVTCENSVRDTDREQVTCENLVRDIDREQATCEKCCERSSVRSR